MSRDYDEELLEPLAYYNNYLKDKFREVTETYFQKLVDESGISIPDNASLMKKYGETTSQSEQLKKKIKRYSMVRNVLIFLGIFDLIPIVWAVYQNNITGNIQDLALRILILAVLAGIYFFIVEPKIKTGKSTLANLDSILKNMEKEGYDMMEPLNSLFHSEMTSELIKEAIPFIHMDPNFNIKRYEQLVKNYSFLEKYDVNNSTLDIASGDILGNPFVFIKRMVHHLGDYTYTGYRTVSYWEYYRDSNGNTRSRRVTETLRATLVRPGPYYSHIVSLIYGNDAAPNLIFHRAPGVKEESGGFFGDFSLKKKISEIRSRTSKSMKEGGSFQGMANEEFDALFNALDRNNEVEFRLLFTPLAQKNYQDIFKNSPYGDDFFFNKERKINEVKANNSQHWDFDTGPFQYWDFSFEKIREKFINFNCSYFDHMYFSFLPLLAIPLYQQMMPADYIYGGSYDYNYNDYMTEMVVNRMGTDLFRPPEADLRDNVKTMLKTSHYRNEKESEIVQVDAYSYRTEKRLDYVSVVAGDGIAYSVPVEWEEYIPVTKRDYIEVTEIKSAGEGYRNIKGLDYYQNSEANENKAFAYGSYIAGKLYRADQPLSELLEKVYAQYRGG